MVNRMIVVVAALVLALAFAAAVIASSMSGSEPKSHTMPNGEQMDDSAMGR
jgi:hypothetical protein